MEPNEPFFIHDRFFKGSMQQIEIAQGMSQLLLPKRIPVKIDYTTLQIVKDSWINVRLNLHATDILYRAEAGPAGHHLLLLFEHKSNVDKLVPLQNYRNTTYVIEEEQSQSKSSIPKLPPVIPIVVYHGKTPWNVDNSITSMFEYIEGTEQFIPQQRSIVIDLGVMPDEEIEGIAEVKAFIMALKYSRSPLLIEMLPQIVGFFNGVGDVRLQYLEFVTSYLERFVPKKMHSEFSKIVGRELNFGDEAMKKFSTYWEKLGYVAGKKDGLKEGEDIGIKKGEKKGEKKGVKKGVKKGKELGLKEGLNIGIKKGRDIGFKEGEDKGIKKGKGDGIKYEQRIEMEMSRRAAVKMIKDGIPIRNLRKYTGLPIDEIAELKKKVENGEL